MKKQESVWDRVRRYAPTAHREGTTPREVAVLVRRARSEAAVGVGRTVEGSQQYAVLLEIESDLADLVRRGQRRPWGAR